MNFSSDSVPAVAGPHTTGPIAENLPGRLRRFLGYGPLVLAFVTLTGTTLISLILPFLAVRWIGLPFIGAFPEQTLVFNSMGSSAGEAWSAYNAGVRFPDRLVALDGNPLETPLDLERFLANREFGDEVLMEFLSADGTRRTAAIVLQRFPNSDFVNYFGVPYVIALAYLAIGWWVFRRRWREWAGRAFAIFCASMAMVIGGLFDLYTTHAFAWAWTIAIPLTSAGLMSLALVFPQELPLVSRYPPLRWIGLLPAGLLIFEGLRWLNDTSEPARYAEAWHNEYVFGGLGILVFLAFTLFRMFRAASPIAREQSRLILLGSLAAFGPLVGYLVLVSIRWPIIFNVKLYFAPTVFFPLAIAYAIMRYRLMDVDVLLARLMLYGVMGGLAGAGYLALLALLASIAGRSPDPDNPLTIGSIAFLLFLVLNPLHDRAQAVLNSLLFRGHRVHQERLQEFTRELAKAADLLEVMRALRHLLDRTLRPLSNQTYLLDPSTGTPNPYYPGPPESQAEFRAGGDVVRILTAGRGCLYLPPDRPLPTTLAGEHDALERLGAVVLVPFAVQGGLLGWLALGPRSRGLPYDLAELRFLESVGDQVALAIQRAQLFEAERRRRRESETLREATAAVTSAVDMPRVLEDILTQLKRVVSYDSAAIFLLDGDLMRIVAGHGLPDVGVLKAVGYPSDNALFLEARYASEPVVLVDAQLDPRFVPWAGTDYVRGWMGVPLKVRGEMIGVLTVDNRRPGAYGPEDVALARAFANQAAIAIANIQQNERLHALYRAGIEAHEAERASLARDLHDGVLNQLAVMASRAGETLRPGDIPEGAIESYRALASRLREMIASLRPAMLDFGLHAGLVQLADELDDRSGGRVDVRLNVPPGEARYDAQVEQHLYRIVQQASENALLHGRPSTLRIRGHIGPENVDVVVEDDGEGFPVRKPLDVVDLLARKKFGLAGILERAAIIGAKVEMDSAPGRGTRVRVRWKVGSLQS